MRCDGHPAVIQQLENDYILQRISFIRLESYFRLFITLLHISISPSLASDSGKSRIEWMA